VGDEFLGRPHQQCVLGHAGAFIQKAPSVLLVEVFEDVDLEVGAQQEAVFAHSCPGVQHALLLQDLGVADNGAGLFALCGAMCS
jgi:hypothetical protein